MGIGSTQTSLRGNMVLKARLHPKWVGGRDGYHYSVIYDGKLLVENSRYPSNTTQPAHYSLKASPAS